MPSVTDVQQQQQQSAASNNAEKSIVPTTQQTTSADSSNADPLTQAVLLLEKKQRNLGKRKVGVDSAEASRKFDVFLSRKSWKVIEHRKEKAKN